LLVFYYHTVFMVK